MTDKISKYSTSHGLMYDFGRPIGWLQLIANFAGACIVTSYFVFFDQVFPEQQAGNTFYVVGIMFVGLVIIAIVFFQNWRKDLNRFYDLKKLADHQHTKQVTGRSKAGIIEQRDQHIAEGYGSQDQRSHSEDSSLYGFIDFTSYVFGFQLTNSWEIIPHKGPEDQCGIE